MDNPQYYQPLSHALHGPVVSGPHSSPRPQYPSYSSHPPPPVTNGAGSGHREEEEEEEDDEEVVEEELDHHDADHPHQSASSHSSPRVNATQTQARPTGPPAPAPPAVDYYKQPTPPAQQGHASSAPNDDNAEKRKPGRPRGSKNRKPRVSTGSASKPPSNVAHPGFFQYPPAPPTVAQNQQFYEFQWRALNLCSEFYSAAEELVLANPSQLVGQPAPTAYPAYAAIPPPPPPGTAGATTQAPGAVITNPQTFVLPLNSSSMPPPSQPYYASVYPPPGPPRYAAQYYYPPPPPPQGAASYYQPPPQPSQSSQPAPSASAPPAQAPPPQTTTPQPATQSAPPTPAPAPAPAPPAPVPASAPVPTNTGTISTFSAATGNTAPGGHQGTWSEEETEKLKRLAEQSKEMGGAQNKGEIEWDWVIQQWGNSRTRHQILLKATSLGLKESTTRGTKRRREAEAASEAAPPPPPPPQAQSQAQAAQQQHQPQQQRHTQQHQPPQHQPPQHQSQQHQSQQHQQHQHQHQQQPPQQHSHQHHQQHQQPPPPPPPASASSVVSPTRSPITSTPASINASPAMQPQRPPSTATSGASVMASARSTTATTPSTSSLPWPMPTVAVNTPSPVMSNATTDSRNQGFYRPRPTATTSYNAAAAAATAPRPPSSHGSTTTHHQYMYQTNGSSARRDSSAMSHVGQAASGAQVGTAGDPNHSHSPTMQLMSQPPTAHTVQNDPNAGHGPYVSVHRFSVSAGPEGYAHHVMPYVQGPPPPHGGELMYSAAADASASQEAAGPGEHAHDESSPPSSTMNGAGGGKRKHSESVPPEGGARKKRQRAFAPGEGGFEDGEMQDMDVGPNGGPKHWTEDEKTRFFTWLLTSDDHWEAFRTRMNTVFRECSNELFPGRKSYTALKSCFHRNLEVFKQIHAFQVFSANHFRQMQAENPHAQQPSVETVLEAARVAGLNVGTINAKVIDRWYETGWYDLFRRRYREDPKTGLPVPYYGPADPSEAGSSAGPAVQAMMGLHAHSSIDSQMMSHNGASHGADHGSVPHPASPEPPHPQSNSSYDYSPQLTGPTPDYRQAGGSTPQAPPTYLRSNHAGPPRAPHSAPHPQSPARPSIVSASRTQSDISPQRETSHPEAYSQIAQAFAQLTSVTESLRSICSSLKELIQQHAEESKARTELMRAEAAQRQQSTGSSADERDKEKEISIEKVTFATEILKNGPDNEDIKKAAIECLTKYLMRGL
ncbi:hypothetical protein C8Q77DRAFT_1071664 [Trametes polyzona]|nr:hypothetical protein C8Q77DRAFT_1071664 [Trametes polyzona]